MKRRSFLKAVGSVAAGGAAAAWWPGFIEAGEVEIGRGGMPLRALGRTGEKVSMVGFPGLALSNYDQHTCNRGLLKAWEQGVNYFDVAPAYGRDGICEVKMGIGLQGIPRDRIFLSCKTKKRDKAGARQELERSLRRLKTDHFDLYQMHCIFTEDEVAKGLGPDGAMETILKAKEEGKIRFIGFSAHTTKGGVAALKGFDFDTVMFPINYVEYFHFGFGREIIELAREKGTGVIAIKPLLAGSWAQGEQRTRQWWYKCTETQEHADLAMRYTLSQANVAAGIPPSYLDLTDMAIAAAKNYQPITDEELKKLEVMAKEAGSVFTREQQRAGLDGGMEPCYARSGCPYSSGRMMA